MCGSDSVVECHLAKVEVAGPNPVSRSKRRRRAQKAPSFFCARLRIKYTRPRLNANKSFLSSLLRLLELRSAKHVRKKRGAKALAVLSAFFNVRS